MKPDSRQAVKCTRGEVRPFHVPVDRRRFLKGLAAASAGFTLPGYLAEALTLTPGMVQGPFYPLRANIPLDKDNDLVQLDDSTTAAMGAVTYLSGRVLDSTGSPVRGALVELWHADHRGAYTYSATTARNPAADANFAGFGQFLTGTNGIYGFRTIKAGLYPGRTRHFHVGVTIPGQLTRFTTQTFWNEVPLDLNGNAWPTTNVNDSLLRQITDPEQRAAVVLDFAPVPGTSTGEQQATFDFVLNRTPVYPEYPAGGSLMVRGQPVRPAGGGPARYELSVPAYAGYSYEIYGNPTLAGLQWKALPFSLSATGAPDRNIHTVTEEGTLALFVDAPAERGFYLVSFRVPGANVGTP